MNNKEIHDFKIKFKIGDFLKEDKQFVVLSLLMSFNDFKRIQEFKNEIKETDPDAVGKRFYLIRTSSIYISDALKIIDIAKKLEVFQKLIDEIPPEHKKILRNDTLYHGKRVSTIKDQFLRPLRNCFAHYFEEDRSRDLLMNDEELTKQFSEIVITQDKKRNYFKFADDINNHVFTKICYKLNEEPDSDNKKDLEQAIKIHSDIIYDIMDFVYYFFRYFYKSHLQNHSKIEFLETT